MQDPFTERLERLWNQIPDQISAIVLGPSSTLRYFTGLSIGLSERPALYLCTRSGNQQAILPELEVPRAQNQVTTQVVFTPWPDTGTPVESARKAFSRAVEGLQLSGPIGIETRELTHREYRIIQSSVRSNETREIDEAIYAVRSRKTESEISYLEKAVEATETVLEAALHEVNVGITEAELASKVRDLASESPVDGLHFLTIVSGARSANPHTDIHNRRLEMGDILMIDLGLEYRGYTADITRTYAVGEADSIVEELFEAVNHASRETRSQIEVGTEYQELDQTAKQILKSHGFADDIQHRVGHGLGLTTREAPFIGEGNTGTITSGNVFTIEPGLYRHGVGGVRIEDNIAIVDDTVRTLTTAPRELQVL